MLNVVLVILISLVLISLIVTLVFLITKKPKVVNHDKEFGALEKQIEMLSTSINNSISLSVSKEIINIQNNVNKSNEMNNEKLERFQQNISKSMFERFDSLQKSMNENLDRINKKVDEKLEEGFKGTTDTLVQVRERLQIIDEAQKNIESLSNEVVSLRTVLEGNQTRGQYGELQLHAVLNNVFGDTVGAYEEQYTLKKVRDGKDVRADAVVFMPEPNKMICIDSKFPFQDYKRLLESDNDLDKEHYLKEFGSAVKKHITVIKDKYIVSGKTAGEAIMFIPNDGVFAFIHHNLIDVIEYAREKKVIITSPSTLPSILWTINMVRIEVIRSKNLSEIVKQLNQLAKQFEQFSKEWKTFSNQLETASKTREKLDTRVGKINNRFDVIKNNSGEIEMMDDKEELITSLDEND